MVSATKPSGDGGECKTYFSFFKGSGDVPKQEEEEKEGKGGPGGDSGGKGDGVLAVPSNTTVRKNGTIRLIAATTTPTTTVFCYCSFFTIRRQGGSTG